MANGHATTVIGSSSFVRGRITGTGDLEIAGRVEGEVACSGDVLVEAGGLVAASIAARRIVVRGAVKGDLSASEAVVLEAGAKVVGDVNAPRVAIAEGALVRGHVQTGAGARPASSEKRGSAAVPQSRSEARSEPRAIAKEPPTARMTSSDNHARKAPPPPPPSKNAMPRGSVLAGAKPTPKAAPAPVVPVLKKGAKATQKKRA